MNQTGLASRRVALVTGASSGIGRCIAETLSSAGYATFGTSRAPDSAAARTFQLLTMDVRDEASVQRCVKSLLASEGRIDVLVNNAGVSLIGAVEDTSPAELAAVLDTNLVGAVRVIQSVLPAMRTQIGGHIVNIGSIGGQIGLPYRGAYSASKSALGVLSEALSMEVARFGVSVTVVEPGDFGTKIHENRGVAARASAGTVYEREFQAVAERSFDSVAFAPPPDRVAALVLHIVQSRRPALRYRVGTPTEHLAVAAKRVLPDRWFESLLLRHVGADQRPQP